MYRLIQKFYDHLLNLLFPARCLSCGKEGAYFCAACRNKIPLRGGFDRDGIFSLWEYGRPEIRNAITSLKYKNKKMLARALADSLHDSLLEHLAERSVFNDPLTSHAYIVIPIPLSQQRFKKRGYNQAELIAQELSQKDPELFTLETSVLCRTKDTEAQVSIKDRERRLQNMRGAFTAKNRERIRNKTVLLVDDVTTTGATLREARRVLLKSGARIVYGVTIAH
ncbi:MAG: ComF family protein [Parcubacteria group bacterium]|nr:ComF family protein [Parcubacteria group bacterium]